MPVNSPTLTAQFHPTLRRKVVAVADVQIQQVQVVDKDGQIRSLILWRCGTDMFYAESIAALSDPQRLRVLPSWVKDQLETLPADKVFDADGNPKTSAAPAPAPAAPTKAKAAPAAGDDDLPEFKSA